MCLFVCRTLEALTKCVCVLASASQTTGPKRLDADEQSRCVGQQRVRERERESKQQLAAG